MNGTRTKKMNGDPYTEDENNNSYEEESPPPMVRQPSPLSSPLRPPSPSPFSKSNILSDYIPLRPAENFNIKMIDSSRLVIQYLSIRKLTTNLFLIGEGSQQQVEVVPMEDEGEMA
jgi:hypothetical protein